MGKKEEIERPMRWGNKEREEREEKERNKGKFTQPNRVIPWPAARPGEIDDLRRLFRQFLRRLGATHHLELTWHPFLFQFHQKPELYGFDFGTNPPSGSWGYGSNSSLFEGSTINYHPQTTPFEVWNKPQTTLGATEHRQGRIEAHPF